MIILSNSIIHIRIFYRGLTQCTQPVEVVSYKIGVCKVSPQGKECKTEFERLSFNGTTSVVLCRPFTGRMHQIRVHLQYLGKLLWIITRSPGVTQNKPTYQNNKKNFGVALVDIFNSLEYLRRVLCSCLS